jgi:hypothetical protein
MVAIETKIKHFKILLNTEFNKSAIRAQQKKILALISQSFVKSNLLIFQL